MARQTKRSTMKPYTKKCLDSIQTLGNIFLLIIMGVITMQMGGVEMKKIWTNTGIEFLEIYKNKLKSARSFKSD